MCMLAAKSRQSENVFIAGFMVNRRTREDANKDRSDCIKITIKSYRKLIDLKSNHTMITSMLKSTLPRPEVSQMH